METSFAIRWMVIGMTSVAVILLVLSLLPIPGQSMLSMNLPFRIASRDDLKANPWGWGREGVEGEGPEQGKGEPQNKRGGEQDGKGPDNGGDQGDKKQDGKQQGDNTKGNDAKGAPKDGSAANEPGEQSNDKERDASEPQSGKDKLETPEKEDANSKKNSDPNSTPKPREPKQDKPAGAEQPPRNNEEKDSPQNAKQPPPQQQPQDRPQQPNQAEQPPPQPPQPSFSIQYDLAAMVQWLMMILLAIVAIVFGIVYRRELLAAMNNFLDWIRMLLGGKKKSPPPKVHVVEEATLLEDLYPPFHSFANPFRKGSGLSHEQMVRHMYRAMLSWGYEHRVVRREDETPEEFMRRLFRRFPEQQESFSALGMLYNRIAYARGKVTAAEMQPLVEFWKWLEQKTATKVV